MTGGQCIHDFSRQFKAADYGQFLQAMLRLCAILAITMIRDVPDPPGVPRPSVM
jgi:hypothetical protein